MGCVPTNEDYHLIVAKSTTDFDICRLQQKVYVVAFVDSFLLWRIQRK